MKTLTLLSVPKTHPSRQQLLDAFKAKHGIETHRSDLSREDHPWCACLRPPAVEMWKSHGRTGEPALFDLVAHLCRRLEESGLLVTGETERYAVVRLCEINGIVFDL